MQEMQEIWVRSLGWEDSPGGENGNPLQHSYLENPTDRGTLGATCPHHSSSIPSFEWALGNMTSCLGHGSLDQKWTLDEAGGPTPQLAKHLQGISYLKKEDLGQLGFHF